MKKIRAEVVVLTAAGLLVLLYMYTAVSKVLEYEKFVFQIRLAPVAAFRVIAPVLGVVVPLVELAIVWLLCKDRYRLTGFYASFLLLLIFEVYISIMLLSGDKLPCTCGGIISQMGWKTHLIFNGVFMAISIAPVLFSRNKNIHHNAAKLRE